MADSERLAPVTYLFGGRRESAQREATPASSRLSADPSAPTVESPRGDRARASRDSRRAENISIAGLTRRNMSRWEIEQLLVSRELDAEVIVDELERLERVGLIDDAALAETLVRTKRERKGLGHQALLAELRRRHIDQGIIDHVLSDAGEDDGTEQNRANELAEKRARSLESHDRETAARRLTGYLMRKGYSSTIVRSAVNLALDRSRSRASSSVRFH